MVGASLALSSSAFVLKLLQEKGQLTERVGSSSLGVLLMQDIAVVPLLVLLPLIVQEQTADSSDAVRGDPPPSPPFREKMSWASSCFVPHCVYYCALSVVSMLCACLACGFRVAHNAPWAR